MSIEVTSEVADAMLRAAGRADPLEVCGILLGASGPGERSCITALIEARNVHPSPQTHFEIDAQALIDAHRSARNGGAEVIGYFHSHPSGDPAPSVTDRALAAHDGKIWAISAGGGLKLWRDDPDGFVPLTYQVL